MLNIIGTFSSLAIEIDKLRSHIAILPSQMANVSRQCLAFSESVLDGDGKSPFLDKVV